MNITWKVLNKVYISFVNMKTKIAATIGQFMVHVVYIGNINQTRGPPEPVAFTWSFL